MCGIVGYVGPRPAVEVLVPGLHRLEYRGYDSAGVALLESDGISITKQAGRIDDLESALAANGSHPGTTGVGHTRWATHGAPNSRNAHPHIDCAGEVAVAHNGIIENHAELRAELQAAGHSFTSDTDTEVVAHLIESMADLPLVEAVREVMRKAEGALALAIVRKSDPDRVVASRRGSPLVLGLGEGENFVASDIPAILTHTRTMAVIDDDHVVEITPDKAEITDLGGAVVEQVVRRIEWDLEAAEKGGYESFMLKEIHEQPQAIEDTLAGRVDDHGRLHLDAVDISLDVAHDFDKVFVIACGTSYHAAMMSKYVIERWTRLPVEIDIASEFRYRDPVLDERTLAIFISQSGETLDTLEALRYAKAQGAFILSVTNVVDSSMARDSDAVMYTRAGPEIGVAATKTFVCQLVAMQLIALFLAEQRGSLDKATIEVMGLALRDLPDQIRQVLDGEEELRTLASEWSDTRDFFFLGRGASFPVAMEGALKLKEIAYVRAEGYAAGEMKHGPIALIEDGVVVVGVATQSHLHKKTLSNMEEMRARNGTIFLVLTEGDQSGPDIADHVAFVPAAPELISPVLSVVPLQILAYAIASGKDLDVDKPRNLAKTVTVE